MNSGKTCICRLVSLLVVVSLFLTACGDQDTRTAQTEKSASATTHALPTHYVGTGDCSGQTPCYATIQDAVNDASTGAVIQVLAGEYLGNITLKSGVVLQGAGAESTIIRGTGTGSVVTSIDVDSTAKIDGFTITGGRAESFPDNPRGGGFYNYNSSPTISNITITGNYASFSGGGIYNGNGSAPTISNTIISGNSAFLYGGGIHNDTGSSPTISQTRISENSIEGGGGGICNSNGSSPVITHTTITQNMAIYDGGGIANFDSSPNITHTTIIGNFVRDYGGGISNHRSSPTITDSTITGNSTSYLGGGIYNWSDSSPTVTNSIISGNSANYGDGGGIYNSLSSPTITNSIVSGNSANYGNGGGICNSLSSATITNSIITGNYATYFGGGIYNYNSASAITNATISGNSALEGSDSDNGGGGIWNSTSSLLIRNTIITSNSGGGIFTDSSAATSDYNDVWNNSGSDYTGLSAGTHDISVDPRFIDVTAGDYRLQAGSSCIDAGSNTAVPSSITMDFHGNPRIADGNRDGTAIADIGAIEYPDTLTLSVTTPANGDALQGIATLQAAATGAQSVEFFVRKPGETEGISIGYDNLTASFDPITGTWKHSLTTTSLTDGYYLIFARAKSSVGAEVTCDSIFFSIRNWSSGSLFPLTQSSKAGRTMPIKFTIRTDSAIDPLQPFVHNEGLEVQIYNSATPQTILQAAHYGLSMTDYRINDTRQFYITNFKTEKRTATYNVKIISSGLVIGQFTFSTVK